MRNSVGHRVVITGMGWSTSLGRDLPTCWRRLIEGASGIGPITFWDPSEYTTKVAAEARHVPQETGLSCIPKSYCRRGARLYQSVAHEAFTDARLDLCPLAPAEIGQAVGTSVNYLDLSLLKHYFRFRSQDGRDFDMAQFAQCGEQPDNSFYRRLGDTIAVMSAKALRLGGPSLLLDTACAASAHAVGEAYRLVRRGCVRAMVAGGSGALVSPLSILAFALLGALSRSEDPAEASRPFDRLRDGFVMGEGAGAVVLESLESCRERGAPIYAEVVGYGNTLNAYNLTDPSPDGVPEARAMALALEEAKMCPEEVDYVAAHGTSTPKNDVNETAAIRQVFGRHANRLMVSSIKGQIGHTISAAGVSNLVCAVRAMGDGWVPPTMNLRNPDPACDLDYVPNRSRRAHPRAALVNAFAFGGQNVSLAVRAWQGA